MKNTNNIVGKNYGKVKILEVLPYTAKNGNVYYNCKVLCQNCNTESIMGKYPAMHGKGMCRACSYKQRPRGLKNELTKDLTGKIFGKLTVIRIDDNLTKKKNRLQWVCKCECGTTKTISGQSLKSGAASSCGCGQGKKGMDSPFWDGYGEISRSYWSKVEFGAKDRNLSFLLTIEEAWDIFIAQNRKCALTGVPIELLKPKTASLDRIDSSKGYTKDNVQWVHKNVNFLKGKLSEKELYNWCKLIIEYNNEKTRNTI